MLGLCPGAFRVAQLRASQPDLIVEHLGELRDLLARHNLDLDAALAERARPVATVGALVFNDAGEVLMVRTHKWSDLWGIPGGKIKFGETSVEALRREVKEETDLDVDRIEFVLAQDCIHSTEFYRDAHFILLNYTCRANGSTNGSTNVTLNEEADEYRWLAPAVAATLPLNTPTRILLAAVQPSLAQAH